MYAAGIDLVVVNYRTAGDLLGFLESYRDADIQVPNTLTVVNVQPDGDSIQVAQDMAGEIFFWYQEHDTNVGYARACNRAVKMADREVVAFFNADTELRPGVVESCYELFRNVHNVGVVGPKQVNEQNKITAAGVFGTQEAPSFDGRWMQYDRGQYDFIQDAINVSGSAYFVRRTAWDELFACRAYRECPDVWELEPEGAFLPTQHYYEETYLSYHALSHGWRVIYNGEVTMLHKWHRASPVGAMEGGILEASRELFRSACDTHGILHE